MDQIRVDVAVHTKVLQSGFEIGWNPASNSEAGGHDLEGEGTGGDDASTLERAGGRPSRAYS